MSNPLQKFEWMLRIPITQMEQGITYLQRLPDPIPADESDLIDAVCAMESAIWNIREWAKKNSIEIKESMHT